MRALCDIGDPPRPGDVPTPMHASVFWPERVTDEDFDADNEAYDF